MAPPPLELWGGLECTLNRVGDRFGDQLALSGHRDRPDDIDRIASLGLSAVRYPVLWEQVSPDHPEQADWAFPDARLDALRAHGIRVIAGLVHHGSGPAYTDLLDDQGFATGLARHAARVAERYPWIEDWTPVNEPLTTARFAALYGHWYPHRRDERAFWRALLNQIDGTRLAMAAIRRVIPHARLIQTDDLGRSFATPTLADQAAFDNLRRWASWDLLCGMVTRSHPLWARLANFGFADRLSAIADAPCPPDIIGINHYLTSDRFLDERLHRYPRESHGGNGRQSYADVAAIRVLDPPPPGIAGAVREAWARYRRPIAITEVHNGCTRDEQLRWLAEGWDTARALRGEGVDLRAVTAWSLFGSCGWNTLLTAPGRYESGVFDVSSGDVRETAAADLLRGLLIDAPRPPVARTPGWWRRPIRLEHRVVHLGQPRPLAAPGTPDDVPPLLICGATGTLGQAFARACAARNIPYVLTDRRQLDLRDPASIVRALEGHRPWAVVNAAGYVRVDAAEQERARCFEANSDGPTRLARAAAARGIATLNFSSDLVFDGAKGDAYVESDAPAPLNAYGESKARMEAELAGLAGRHLIVRTAAFFSPFDAHNFAVHAAHALRSGQRFAAAEDQVVTPTFVPHLVDAALDLLIDPAEGVWHLTNGAAMSWAEFARAVARALGLDTGLIDAVPAATLGFAAPRPPAVPLASTRGALMPSFDAALSGFVAGLAVQSEAPRVAA
ncbi:MAG: sugar nucleotide-binding protein [Sphingomonas sp.]|uniref:family 1 glycosylhydrolase n=1 Tax=Sphingomonas sp. TaxID=28214 RepID=UPI0025D3F59A|nr:family 1 glycosylhydrolase [Sphingomonas sp.]MBX9881694.1 sugar nucleotide-binding protein [Sphingomonas sp.]